MVIPVIPKRCSVCAQFLSTAYRERSPHAKTCGAPSCRKERTRLVSTVYEYKPPEPGDHDHADPFFKSRSRLCGKCQRPFETTPKYRYYCGLCRLAPARQRAQNRAYSAGSKFHDYAGSS